MTNIKNIDLNNIGFDNIGERSDKKVLKLNYDKNKFIIKLLNIIYKNNLDSFCNLNDYYEIKLNLNSQQNQLVLEKDSHPE